MIVRALLAESLDYAGLFPPARLSYPEALSQYLEYTRHPHAWMLARFVLPVDLIERAAVLPRVALVVKGESVRLPELPPCVETIEVAGSLDGRAGRLVFHEIDWRGGYEVAMDRIEGLAGVKLRTGGLTADAVPPAAHVAGFLTAAAKRRLPVKFTAGLHQPFPHQDTSTGARLHGFLNVLSAAMAAYEYAAPASELARMIEELTLRLGEDSMEAGPFRFTREQVKRLRAHWVHGFGSCSFLEPVEALESLHIL